MTYKQEMIAIKKAADAKTVYHEGRYYFSEKKNVWITTAPTGKLSFSIYKVVCKKLIEQLNQLLSNKQNSL
jgi:hypothetical protein